MDIKQNVITKSHLSLQLRWAKKKRNSFITYTCCFFYKSNKHAIFSKFLSQVSPPHCKISGFAPDMHVHINFFPFCHESTFLNTTNKLIFNWFPHYPLIYYQNWKVIFTSLKVYAYDIIFT